MPPGWPSRRRTPPSWAPRAGRSGSTSRSPRSATSTTSATPTPARTAGGSTRSSTPTTAAWPTTRRRARRAARASPSSTATASWCPAAIPTTCTRPAEGARTARCGPPLAVEAEAVQQRVVGAPAAAHAHDQVEVDPGPEVALELLARGGPDRADHLAAGADEDALLRLGLHPRAGVDDREVVARVVDLLDDDLDRVRDLLEGPAQDLLADELGEVHVGRQVAELV